ncbi:MAG: peptide chain release factor N(5)-glutamine methyltransferase [Eubacterium sp.]|nr:peptide chain release factor N(5)-glutamine methyltransferase [Eubacterium sp.]
MILADAYTYALDYLNRNNIDEADFKSLCLCSHLAGMKNSQFRFHKNDEVSKAELDNMLSRLKKGEPLQYVLGKWDFYESEFYVGNGVLIPRPETEELVELAVSYIKTLKKCTVYDLCAGSGCIGLSIAKACPNAKIILIEKSIDAFFYLKENAEGIPNAHIVLDDINNSDGFEQADVIISNPPYIKSDDIAELQNEVHFEPELALDGGADGLDFYRIINDKWSPLLKSGGRLFLEIGNEQGKDIINVLNNYKDIEVIKDMYGNDRMVIAEGVNYG